MKCFSLLRRVVVVASCVATLCGALRPATAPVARVSSSSSEASSAVRLVRNAVAAAGLSAATCLSVLTPGVAHASSPTAAQISLNSLPPATIDVQIRDLPVVGALLSGTYSKIDDGVSSAVKTAAVTIKSPADKVKAVKAVATGGHLEFDVSGLLSTHLDVDVAVDTPGVATIRVASPLIPKLPFQNAASLSASQPVYAGKSSPWKMVTDLGDGKSYYYNDVTEVTQFEKPADLGI